MDNPLHDYMYLNSTDGQATTNIFGLDITRSNDGTFYYVNADYLGANNINYLAYCFHSIPGFSKIGEYKGNGNVEGPFVHLGFRPALVMIKLTSANGTNWNIFDNKRDPSNVTGAILAANTNAVEADQASVDILSNGFKIRHAGSYVNTNTADYLYMAFAEAPFKYANAR